MVDSKMKKVNKSVTSFEVRKMYIHEDGDLVVVYTGEGDHFSTFSGIVLYSTGSKSHWNTFADSSCFLRSAFSEFHGEITLTS